MRGRLVEQVALGPTLVATLIVDSSRGVDRRVRDLREQLLEVAVEERLLVGEDGKCEVVLSADCLLGVARASGVRITFMSSCDQPNASWRERSGSPRSTPGVRSRQVGELHVADANHALYGLRVATSAPHLLVRTIRSCSCRARKIFPGCSRPLRRTFSAGMSSTPASDASTTQPSFVSSQRPGRSPLRSSVAPITRPSVNAIAAGPSTVPSGTRGSRQNRAARRIRRRA